MMPVLLVLLLCHAAVGATDWEVMQYTREQLLAWHRLDHIVSDPFPPIDTHAKHTPFLTLQPDATALITVGLGTVSGESSDPIHLNTVSTDPAILHYLTAIFAVDPDTDQVVAMINLSPTSPAQELRFTVPGNVTRLTPYVHCNIHGLFRGNTVSTAGIGPPSGGGGLQCQAPIRGGSSPPCIEMEARQTEYRRRANFTSAPTHTVSVHLLSPTKGQLRYQGGDKGSVEAVFATDHNGTVLAMAVGPHLPETYNFDIPRGTRQLIPHANDILSGLVSGVPVAAPPTYSHCMKEATCSSMERRRKQVLALHQREHGEEQPFPPVHVNRKHIPFLIDYGGTAEVVVGLGMVTGQESDLIHPTTPSSDPELVHYIETIYVVDADTDRVVAMAELSAIDRPRLTFVPPAGATLIPYSFCNTHGLFVGHPVKVVGAAVSSACQFSGCPSPVHENVLNSIRANLMRRNMSLDSQFVIPVPLLTVSGDEGTVTYPADAMLENLHVVDQAGDVVAMQSFLHSPQSPLRFHIPPGASSLTPYAFHSQGGLARGAAVQREAPRCALSACSETLYPIPFPATPAPTPLPTSGNDDCLERSDLPGYRCMQQIADGISLHWLLEGTVLNLAVRSSTSGWLGVSFPAMEGRMVPALALIALDEAPTGYSLIEKKRGGVNEDSTVLDVLKVIKTSAERSGGWTTLHLQRDLDGSCTDERTSCATDVIPINVAWGYGLELEEHKDKVSISADFTSGSFAVIEDIKLRRYVHGVLMITAWCFMIPVAILVKRFGKPIFGLGMAVSFSSLGVGFIMHVLLNVTALGLVTIAVILRPTPAAPELKHRELGITVLTMALAQLLLGTTFPVFFPKAQGKPRRIIGRVHRVLGMSMWVMAVTQCVTGVDNLERVNAEDHSSLRIAVYTGFSLFIALSAVLEVARRRPHGGGTVRIDRDRLSWANVAQHSTREDPWVVINGHIFAIKPWLATHPGGEQVLLNEAGKDATSAFRRFAHSQKAYQKMWDYYVADVEDHRTSNAIELAEQITRSLVLLDLEEADGIIDSCTEDDIPTSLLLTYRRLIMNLWSYKPFLPPNLFEEEKEADDAELEPISPGVCPAGLDRVTLVFTDIQASCDLWETCGRVMKSCLRLHNKTVRSEIIAFGGYEVKTIGDAFMVAFSSPESAVEFSLRVQLALLQTAWPSLLYQNPICRQVTSPKGILIWGGIRVRIGVHTGPVDVEVSPTTGRADYYGPTVNKAARIEARAVGGSVLVSEEVYKSIGESGLALMHAKVFPMGEVKLKGVPPCQLYTLLPSDLEERIDEVAKGGQAQQRKEERHMSIGLGSNKGSLHSGIQNNSFVTRKPAALQNTFHKSTISVANVHVAFRFLTTVPDASDAVNEVVRIIQDSSQRCEGTIHSVSGNNFLLAWNLVHRCGQHLTQATRFAALLHSQGWGKLDLYESWGGKVRIGISTGGAIHGNSGSEQRFVMLIGGCVDLVSRLSQCADELNTFALLAAAIGQSSTVSESSVSMPFRVVNHWEVEDRPVIVVYELNLTAFVEGEKVTTWGLLSTATRDHPAWCPEFRAAAAVRNVPALERMVADIKQANECHSCHTNFAQVYCSECKALYCLLCAKVKHSSSDHHVVPAVCGSLESLEAILQNAKGSPLISKPLSVGLELPQHIPKGWLSGPVHQLSELITPMSNKLSCDTISIDTANESPRLSNIRSPLSPDPRPGAANRSGFTHVESY